MHRTRASPPTEKNSADQNVDSARCSPTDEPPELSEDRGQRGCHQPVWSPTARAPARRQLRCRGPATPRALAPSPLPPDAHPGRHRVQWAPSALGEGKAVPACPRGLTPKWDPPHCSVQRQRKRSIVGASRFQMDDSAVSSSLFLCHVTWLRKASQWHWLCV